MAQEVSAPMQPQVQHSDDVRAERAVVIQLLRDDHDQQWTLGELREALSDVDPPAIAGALGGLEAEGVVYHSARYFWATVPIRHLDALGLIAV